MYMLLKINLLITKVLIVIFFILIIYATCLITNFDCSNKITIMFIGLYQNKNIFWDP